MRLLVLIRDLQYTTVDKKRSIMATIKGNFDLYSCTQRGQLPSEYYNVFASTVDTINVSGDSAGLHIVVFKRHFNPMKEKGVEKTVQLWEDLMFVELKMA